MLSKNEGFSLLEIILVLIISIVLFSGAMYLYNKVKMSNQIHQETKNIAFIKTSIETLFAGKATYTGLNQYTLLYNKMIPDNMISNSSIINAWGGSVTIGLYNSSYPAYYAITYYNVPVEACARLATAMRKIFPSVSPYSSNALVLDNDDMLARCTDSNYKAFNGIMTFSTWGSSNANAGGT